MTRAPPPHPLDSECSFTFSGIKLRIGSWHAHSPSKIAHHHRRRHLLGIPFDLVIITVQSRAEQGRLLEFDSRTRSVLSVPSLPCFLLFSYSFFGDICQTRRDEDDDDDFRSEENNANRRREAAVACAMSIRHTIEFLYKIRPGRYIHTYPILHMPPYTIYHAREQCQSREQRVLGGDDF